MSEEDTHAERVIQVNNRFISLETVILRVHPRVLYTLLYISLFRYVGNNTLTYNNSLVGNIR